MSERRPYFLSRRTRSVVFGVASALLLLLAGDRASTAIPDPLPIDPLDILRVQSRPNVLIVLSTASTMSDTLNSPSLPTASRLILGGDHSASKLSIAKSTIKQFVDDNETVANFQLGVYEQPYGSTLVIPETAASGRLPSLGGVPAHRFIYTSTDANAAAICANPGSASLTVTGNIVRDGTGSPCGGTDNITDSDGTTLFRLWSGLFLNGDSVTVDSTGAVCTPTTPGTATNPATIDVKQITGTCASPGSGTTSAVFTFQGVAGDWGNPSGSCGGHLTKLSLASCNDVDQLTDVTPFLDPQIKIDTGSSNLRPFGYPSPDSVTEPAITTFGLLNGGHQPIAETLIDLKSDFTTLYSSVISNITPASARPKTAVILITDGDDTCVDSATPDTTLSSTTLDENALRAAHKAELLLDPINATDGSSSVSTYVIAYGAGVNTTRANWIAYGGTGMSLGTTGTGTATRWSAAPTASELANCSDCQGAYQATDSTTLYAAMLDATALAANSGQFSAAPQIVATIFELVVDPDGAGSLQASAFDPDTRYSQRVNILFQSTFDLPLWRGRLFAFRNDGTFLPAPGVNNDGTFVDIWEPGATLFTNVVTYMRNNSGAGGTDRFTFAELHGNATVSNLSNAIIKRRVFTTSRNGVWTRDTSGDTFDNPRFDAEDPLGTNVVALWPPNDQSHVTSANIGTCGTDGVDPTDPATAGCLDTALGISGLTLSEYQSIFGACEDQATPDSGFGNLSGTPSGGDPFGCLDPAPPKVLEAARKEARQIVLAYIAGAAVALGTDGEPLRSQSSGEMIFLARDWLLADTQFAGAAIATPPLRFEPSKHISEFTLYRDGRRDASGEGIEENNLGFGLRAPDFDNADPETDIDLKPVMSVVYLGTNERLHAIRGGPRCPDNLAGSPGCSPDDEQGSEELWSFVPYDLLPKQKELIENRGQTREPHTYGIASSVRVASVFNPSTSGYTINGAPFEGRWRTTLYFGRGAGGKQLTAIDVTSPGPFTRAALQTNPPFVVWSRGNPDTTDGVDNGCSANLNADTSDCQLYDDMGQTWSTPAIGNVNATTAGGACTGQPEWRVWMGSGYGDTTANTGEGKRFYELDALTGDVCRTFALGAESSLPPLTNDVVGATITDNALVAPPAAFNPRAQEPPGTTSLTSTDRVTRVYIGDLQGRMWHWNIISGSPNLLHSAGGTQPIADGAALLKLSTTSPVVTTDQPVVFFETGNDSRVPDSAAPFMLFGVVDNTGSSGETEAIATAPSPGTGLLFTQPLPTPAPPFRGTTQPATAFNENGFGRVFFAGTRFVPGTTATACAGSFETVLFGLSALTGGAVYDYSGDSVADLYTTISGNKTTGIQVVGGSVVVGESGSLANAPTPTPDPSPTPTPTPPTPAYVTQKNFKMNSPVCRL